MNIKACIMAGGIGSRFWPASREEKPKQFLDILGLNRSLLQLTYDRYIALGMTPEDIYVVTNEQYVDQVKTHLPQVPAEQIIGETARRNTAPAAYLGNSLIRERDGECIVIMAPSDHHIEDDAAFQAVIRTGQSFLEKHDALITIGINPTFPHTGYGYINYDPAGDAPYAVKSFTEKPNIEKATAFLEEGGYLWNAGIFMWKTSTLDQAFNQHSPSIKNTLDKTLKITNGAIDQASLVLAFETVDDASIDYEIMERASNVYTIPASMKWSDLGSWKSLYDKSDKNEDRNVILAEDSLINESTGNLIFAPGKKIVVKGLNDFMIIEDDNTIVISPIKDNQEIKQWRKHFVNS